MIASTAMEVGLAKTKGQKKAISAKIGHLIKEGKTPKQAAGAAFGMAREGRLGPKGEYIRKKGKK